jgi:hypothetical protein
MFRGSDIKVDYLYKFSQRKKWKNVRILILYEIFILFYGESYKKQKTSPQKISQKKPIIPLSILL